MPLETPDFIVFDLMETLVTRLTGTDPYWKELGAILDTRGLAKASSFDAAYQRWRSDRTRLEPYKEITLQQRLALVLPELRPAEIEDVAAAYMETYIQRSLPLNGAKAMLREWKGRCGLGVISNFFVAGAPQKILERHGMSDCFEFILDSAQVGYRKPATQIFELGLNNSFPRRENRGRILMIGDDWEADVVGATKAGITAIFFSSRRSSHESVFCMSDWNEFRPGSSLVKSVLADSERRNQGLIARS